MTLTRVLCAGLISSSLFGASLASAHHSMTSTYTRSETTSIEGVVKSFSFRNPHVLLYVDVEGENGTVVNWMGEGSSATGWRRVGWTGGEFQPGDTVRITGTATIDGSPMVWLNQMEKLDPETGTVTASYSPRSNPNESGAMEATEGTNDIIPLTLPSGVVNLSGVTRSWEPPEAQGPFYRNDQSMPYNAAGKAARTAVDITNDPQVFCDPPGLGRQAGFSPYGFTLVQEDDKIIIDYEEYSSRREIPLGDQLPGIGPKSHLGDSIARYEGDSLVIETINLLPNWINHTGDIISDEARITEVMTRADNEDEGSIIKVSVTITDPKFLTKPRTVTRYKVFTQGYKYVENICTPPLRHRKGDTTLPVSINANGGLTTSPPSSMDVKDSGDKTASKALWAALLLVAFAIGAFLIVKRKKN